MIIYLLIGLAVNIFRFNKIKEMLGIYVSLMCLVGIPEPWHKLGIFAACALLCFTWPVFIIGSIIDLLKPKK